MRVVFLGTPATAVPALEALLAAGHDVCMVVTQPDRPARRSSRPQPTAVKTRALAHGLRLAQPVTVKDARFHASIAGARPDVLVVVAYGRLLPSPVLEAAPQGAVNLHFSLLPELRGAAPVQWALARGASETGVTTFRLDSGLDTGDLLLQQRVAIRPGEHAPSLLGRLAEEGAPLLVATLSGLASGTIHPVAQDHARATVAPSLTRADGLWDSSWSALGLEGRVRGFDPWPGVWAARSGARIRIVEARALSGAATDALPGTVLAIEAEAAQLACAGGTVAAVETVQLEGRRVMSAREAANGRSLLRGDVLERIESAT